MNVLITGTAGFIGFHVARRLLAEGHRVTGLDAFTPYYDPALKRARNRILEQSPLFTSIEAQLEPLKPDIVDRIDRLRQLRAELGVLLAAPEPDRAAIDSHLREIRLEVGAMQERIQSKTMDAVVALPAAERAPLATPAPDRGKD